MRKIALMYQPLRLFVIAFFFLSSIRLFSQQRFTVSGTITEASSNETLIGVTLLVPEINTGVTTNDYGFYSLTLPEGEYQIRLSYLGYQEIVQTISLTEDLRINFEMFEEVEQLDEVVVTEDVEKVNIRKPQMSVNTLSVQTIKKIPVILGEADVIKSLLLLPGVTSAGEASSGFNVRGGAADQNLILAGRSHYF